VFECRYFVFASAIMEKLPAALLMRPEKKRKKLKQRLLGVNVSGNEKGGYLFSPHLGKQFQSLSNKAKLSCLRGEQGGLKTPSPSCKGVLIYEHMPQRTGYHPSPNIINLLQHGDVLWKGCLTDL